MKIQQEKILALTLTVLLFISLIGSLVLFRNNSLLNDGLNEEKLRTGSLMEEKVTLTKEIAQLNKDSQTMKDLRKEVAELQQLRSALESQVSALMSENSKLKEGMEDLEDHFLALQKENSTLSQELEKMKQAAAR